MYLFTQFRLKGMLGSFTPRRVSSSKLDVVDAFRRLFFDIFHFEKVTWETGEKLEKKREHLRNNTIFE